jgi:hypothetical protein
MKTLGRRRPRVSRRASRRVTFAGRETPRMKTYSPSLGVFAVGKEHAGDLGGAQARTFPLLFASRSQKEPGGAELGIPAARKTGVG